VKITFWLLDLNYEKKADQPGIRLWGISSSGERILIIDRNLPSYFYAVVNEDADPTKLQEEIRNGDFPSVKKVEVVERKFFGKPVKAVKVYCSDPDVIAEYAKELRKFEGVKDCFEDDIRHAMRYLIDNNIQPCGWHEVEATETTGISNIKVDKLYLAKATPKLVEKAETPKLRVLGFSTIYYSQEGSPKPERNPIVIISTATNCGDQEQFSVDEDRKDKHVLEDFIDYVQQFDPDIIVGYGVNGQHWQYLQERCKESGLHLFVDRDQTEPRASVYSHVSLTGRVNLDLADYVEEFQEIKVKTLENFADFLGVMKIENRTIIEDIDIAGHWNDKAKRETLKKFSLDNTCCIMGITEAVLDFAIQLSNLVGLPLDHVGTAAAGFRVEWFLIKQTHRIGELVPKRIEQPYRPYAGGLVLKPIPGLHDNIAALDFKSMYPNLMITYNLSPDTYVSPTESMPAGGVYETPEVGHKFRKEPPGFYKEGLTYLIKVRSEIRAKMKKLSPTSPEYRVLDSRQKAIKIITNATYGYAGWTGARWYVKPVAEAAAAYGRHTIQSAVQMAEKEELKVVYGDTDSIFLQNDKQKVEKLEKDIMDKLKLEIAPDKVYTRIFFTEAKKRYAGLLQDGRLDIVGLEVVRGDWAGIAKTVQEKVLEIILKEQSQKKALEYVQQVIRELRQERVPYSDLIIWKTLSKKAEEYKVNASHVEAAKMLKAKGWETSVGDKIGYVIVTGTGRLYERVKPYVLATYDNVDLEYYVNKQIIPAAVRILESFGITEEQLLAAKPNPKETKTLTDFFGSR